MKNFLLLALFLACLIVSCNEVKKSKDNNNIFKLVYSADINGEIEACG
ncbi:hypothetical protein IT568_12655 [bacterium]|nr:hypothetical protein [bacterium]